MSSAEHKAPQESPKAAIASISILSLLVISGGRTFAMTNIGGLLDELGISTTVLGTIFAPASFLVAGLVALGVAFTADYFGRARVFAFTMVAAATGFVINGMAPSVFGLLTSTFLLAACMDVVAAVVIVQIAGQHRGRWLATMIACLYMAMRLGSMSVTTLSAFEVSWSVTMNALAGAAAVCAVLLFFLMPGRKPLNQPLRTEPFDLSVFWVVFGAFALFRASSAGMDRWSIPLLMDLGDLPRQKLAMYMGFGFPVGILGLITGGVSADYLAKSQCRGYALVAMAGALLGSLSMLLMIFAETTATILTLRMLTTFSAGVVLGPAVTMALLLANNQLRVAALVMLALGGTLGRMLGSTLAGPISDSFGVEFGASGGIKIAIAMYALPALAACAGFYYVSRNIDSAITETAPTDRVSSALTFEKQVGDVVDRRFVKDGFSWPAFFFGPLWAWSRGMVGLGFGLLLGNIAVNAVVTVGAFATMGAGPVPGVVLTIAGSVAWMIFVGKSGNNWRRGHLLKRGFVASTSRPKDHTPPETKTLRE